MLPKLGSSAVSITGCSSQASECGLTQEDQSARSARAGFTAVCGIGGDRTRPISSFFTNRYCPVVSVQNGVVVNRGAASLPRGLKKSTVGELFS
ncbi:hypothetical protein MHYP_G00068940 [Metynnis hypsauchen]